MRWPLREDVSIKELASDTASVDTQHSFYFNVTVGGNYFLQYPICF